MGEASIQRESSNYTIIRPSVVFGDDDNFFNQFARILSLSPIFPLIGNGDTKFQPVYVGDVVKAIAKCLELGAADGNTYELGGPRVLSTKDLMQMILDAIGRRRFLIPTPFWYLTLVASFLEFLPSPLITKDQVRSLREDNVVSSNVQVLEDLDISSTDLEAIIPHYLLRFRKSNSGGLKSI